MSAADRGPAGEVTVSRDVLRTLVTSLEAFWADHEFAKGTPPYERDAAAIAEARTALRGRPARAAVVPHQGPRPRPASSATRSAGKAKPAKTTTAKTKPAKTKAGTTTAG